MRITYAVEGARVVDEIVALLPAHQREFEVYEPPIEGTPDVEQYRSMIRAGSVIVCTARNGDELIGYWLGLPFDDLHHSLRGERVKMMVSANFYITPYWRPRIARRFFRFIESIATERGISIVGQRVRPGDGRSAKFLEGIGYKVTEIALAKQIGAAHA